MICPKCNAEYLDHIKECGDCGIAVIKASILGIPVPESSWFALQPFEGKIYADMAAEILDKEGIPYYLKMDWSSSAYSICAATIPNQIVQILVPEDFLERASKIVSSINRNKN